MKILVLVRDSAYLSLVTFGLTNLQLRDALLRMVQTYDTVPELALCYALLAFSSLCRDGLQQQAVQLKIAALHYLSASAKAGSLSLVEAAQHAAASMLLGAFEVSADEVPEEDSAVAFNTLL